MRDRRYRRNRDTFVWGLVLIGIGLPFLFSSEPNNVLRHWWPLLVVVTGLGSIVHARGPKGVGSAVMTAALGGWLLVATNGWYGLGWSRSWPLVIVAMGLGAITEAIVAHFWRGSEEDIHVS
jgi:hypothetical protein